jgi:hypothetical protein
MQREARERLQPLAPQSILPTLPPPSPLTPPLGAERRGMAAKAAEKRARAEARAAAAAAASEAAAAAASASAPAGSPLAKAYARARSLFSGACRAVLMSGDLLPRWGAVSASVT